MSYNDGCRISYELEGRGSMTVSFMRYIKGLVKGGCMWSERGRRNQNQSQGKIPRIDQSIRRNAKRKGGKDERRDGVVSSSEVKKEV
jgi:hypothetical protein